MNRKVLGMTAAVAAVVILVIAAGWRASAPLPATQVSESGSFHTVAMSGEALSGDMNAVDEAGMSEQERHAARVSALVTQLGEFQRTPGNLQAFLQALHRQCDSVDACEALLTEVLAQHPDRDFADRVARVVAKLPFYEREMQSLVMSTETSPRERYERVHALRERTLGAEETALAFGQERAWAEYQFAYGDLQARAAGMTPQQRLAALNELRSQAFGSYAPVLRDVEGAAGAYEREVALLLVGVEDAARRAQITEQARRRHFDADTVVQLAARDSQLAEQQKQVGDFQADAARLRQELEPLRAGMDPAAWNALQETRMTELRLRHFPLETP